MADRPESRKVHITRIFGTNKAGDRIEDIWVDVERMDVIKSAMQVPPDLQWQAVQRKFRWCDDPNADDYNPDGTPSRNIEILKVCDPENSDVDDPDEWVPIKVVKAIRARIETGTADNGGTAMDRFLNNVTNSDLASSRVVEVRKIIHRDTSIDDEAQAAADADSSLREYVVQSSDYVKDDSTNDDTQYVEQEIITYLKHKGNAGDVSGIGRQTKLLNQYLIDDSEQPSGEVIGQDGINPPYRLDPFQNIVNVNFSGKVIVVFLYVSVTTLMHEPIYTVLNDSAELLAEFDVDLISGDPVPGIARAYKVNTGEKEFISTVMPDLADLESIGNTLFALVFAPVSGDDSSMSMALQRAKDGTKLVYPAYYRENHSGGDLPDKVDPPGLLWSVSLNGTTSNFSTTWKIRRGAHRNKDDSLPNSMVQLYPMCSTYTNGSSEITWTGYTIRTYRLDKAGTDQSYGTDYGYPDSDTGQPGTRMDEPWRQIINGDILVGIPFGDPPPLITVDVPSA